MKREKCKKQKNILKFLKNVVNESDSFGKVYKCKRKYDQKEFAVKIINKTKLNKEGKNRLQTELFILKSIKHSNIICAQNIFDNQNKTFISKINF
jgi:serine/threonine protein kinase